MAASAALTTFVVPNDYGYVLLIALGAIPVLSFVQGSLVVTYRKSAKVPYPNLYATPQQVKESRDAYTFNCAQRAHGQLLENMPQTIAYMLVAGLLYPRATAAMGAGWVVSRLLYAYGYITSTKPGGQGRYLGTTFWLFQGALWGMACAVGAKLAFGTAGDSLFIGKGGKLW